MGAERGAPADEAIALAEEALRQAGVSPLCLAMVATLDVKADEASLNAVAAHFQVPLRVFDAATLEAETPRLATPSDIVFAEVGCHGVAEGAALAAGGPDAALILPSAASGADRPVGLTLGLRSFVVALTNPKALLFMSAFLPQFIDPQAPLLTQYAIVACVLATINILTMLVYATLGAQLVRAFQGSGLRWLNRVCGSLMIGLAGTLALYRRGAP